MRKKMFKLTGAFLILCGGFLASALTPKDADALTCREIFNQCIEACSPADPFCGQDCQCLWLNCRGIQCN